MKHKTNKNWHEIVAILVSGLVLGALMVLSLQWFNDTYILQSPIVVDFQKPWRARHQNVVPTTKPKPQVSPRPSQSPTKAPSKSSGLVGQVMASDTSAIVTGPKEYIIDKIHAVFGKDGDIAVAVARCESGLRYNATNVNTNGSTDAGVFQINSIHKAKYEGRDIYDVDTNIDVAYQIYKAQGFSPWVVYKSGCYKAFL